MKILVVCHRFPYPPNRGGKIRPFHIIRHLSRSHEVTVASMVRSEEEAMEGKGLAAYCANYEMARVSEPVQALRMVARLPTSTPSSMGYFFSALLGKQINGLLRRERFDVVFVHCSSVAQYVESLHQGAKILDFGDMDSQKWLEYSRYKPFPLSLGYRVEGTKLQRAEKRLATSFDMCTVTTRAECETLRGFGTTAATDWFPNGVDGEYFAPIDEGYEMDSIVFLGRMDYYPNEECMLDFCANVLPRLQAERPGVRLTIVGADPTRSVRRLGKLPGVTVTGSVADVRPFLHRSAVMVAPLNIARGTQNKILEAMAAGLPVVTSSIAAGGVDAFSPEHFLEASTPDQYVAAILDVLSNNDERRRLSLAGRARMRSHHTWEKSMLRLDGIIADCLATKVEQSRRLQ
jgi:polysaccharide biosynthesis protein PslH